MSLRAVAALATAFATALAAWTAWGLWPLESGLALGHATLASILAAAAWIRASRLERMHLDAPHPSDVAGPAWASAAAVLTADALHGILRCVLQADELPLLLAAAGLLALLLHVLVETWRPTPRPAW